MADELELLVRSIEGEAPSSDFVATLRERIAIDIAAAVDVADEPVVEFDLRAEADSSTRWPARWVLAAVAAAIILIVGFTVLRDGSTEGGIETIDSPLETSTTIAETSDNLDGSGSQEQALSVANSYTEALVSLDAEALPALFGADGAGGEGSGLIEEILADNLFFIESGAKFEVAECTEPQAQPDDVFIISCMMTGQEALDLAIGYPASPFTATLTIGNSGIQDATYVPIPSAPNLNLFRDWMAQYHPNEALPPAPPFFDIDEAQTAGRRLGELARVWAAFNDRYSCTLDNVRTCGPTAVAKTFFFRRIARDVDEMTALLDPAVELTGDATTIADYETLVAFENATGLLYQPAGCRAEGLVAPARVTCEIVVLNDWSTALGVGPFDMEFELVVTDDNQIVQLSRTVDSTEFVEQAWTPFLDWLAEKHPEDLADMLNDDGNPVTTPDALQRWDAYTDEFVEAQS
jgi:hypothetical protein